MNLAAFILALKDTKINRIFSVARSIYSHATLKTILLISLALMHEISVFCLRFTLFDVEQIFLLTEYTFISLYTPSSSFLRLVIRYTLSPLCSRLQAFRWGKVGWHSYSRNGERKMVRWRAAISLIFSLVVFLRCAPTN